MGFRLSLADAIKYGSMLVVAGGMWATIVIKVDVLNEKVAQQKADIAELRAEVREVNKRYIDLIAQGRAARRARGQSSGGSSDAESSP